MSWRDPATGVVHAMDEDLEEPLCTTYKDLVWILEPLLRTNDAPTCLLCVSLSLERQMLRHELLALPRTEDEA